MTTCYPFDCCSKHLICTTVQNLEPVDWACKVPCSHEKFDDLFDMMDCYGYIRVNEAVII